MRAKCRPAGWSYGQRALSAVRAGFPIWSWPGPVSEQLTRNFRTSVDSGSRSSAADPTVPAMSDTEFSASEDTGGPADCRAISASPGVTDWRVLWGGGYAAARFLTGSFAAGLAREISAAAARLQAPHDPAAVQHVQVAIDALDIAKARPFWHSVLGYAAARRGCSSAYARWPGSAMAGRPVNWGSSS